MNAPWYAENISNVIKQWIEASVKECRAKEVHVEIQSSGTSFVIHEVGGIGFSKEDLEDVVRLKNGERNDHDDLRRKKVRESIKALGTLSDSSGLVQVSCSNQMGLFDSVVAVYGRGCRLMELKHSIDGFGRRKQGTRVTVKDWGDPEVIREHASSTVDLGRTVVRKVRRMVEDFALIIPNVTFTLYYRRTKKFVFKSLGREHMSEKAAAFFGKIDKELIVPLEIRCQGWSVTGYTVLPPVGHASRARQRIYFDSILMESKRFQDRIGAVYKGVCQDAVKLLPRNGSQDLVSVRRSLNAHPMFVIYISTDIIDYGRYQADISSGTPFDYLNGSLGDLVESALLQSWRTTLSGRILGLLEARCRQVETQEIDEHSGYQSFPNYVLQKRNIERETGSLVRKRESLFDDLEHFRCGMDGGTDGPQNTTESNPHGRPAVSISSFPKRRRSLEGRESVENVLSSWKNSHVMMPHANRESSFFMPVSTLHAHEQKTFCRLNSHRITREDLMECRVVGQIEKKFIAFVSTSGKLGLIDQHAADERVKLENLQARVLTDKNKPNQSNIIPWKVTEKLQIHVGEDELALFEEYRRQAYMWGWRWEPWCPNSQSIIVTHLPLLCGRLLSASDLKLYIYQLDQTSACNIAPQGVHRVLASVACRSAIMFGDVLDMEQARILLSNLSGTVQYYECAHGRPTVSSLAHIPSVRTIRSSDGMSSRKC